jgi:dipeptidyl aminopeptidase/acylaminoacyl peptidase
MSKLFIAFSALCFCCAAATAQTNGTILSREKVAYPAYKEVPGIEWYYSEDVYATATRNQTIRSEKIFYSSDGLKVVAYFSTPATPQKKKYPVIVFNRGSYLRNDIAYVHAPLFQKLVQAGFIVVAPALRQSEGGEGKDEVGGKDVNDIFNILPLLASLQYADTSKLFMLGESRGGIMTYIALREGFPAKAAATIGAITDIKAFNKDFPDAEKLLQQAAPEYATDKEETFRKRSAVYWADTINVPVLILNGQADPQIKPYHALNLAARLQDHNKTYQLMILEGGNHILSGKWTTERDSLVIEWFRKYLEVEKAVPQKNP